MTCRHPSSGWEARERSAGFPREPHAHHAPTAHAPYRRSTRPVNDNGSVFSGRRRGVRFRLSHATDSLLSAVYGFDAGPGGYFIEVLRRRKVTKTYDPLTPGYNVERPLWGALVFLASKGFFTKEELHETLLALEHHRPDVLPARVCRVAEVVTHFQGGLGVIEAVPETKVFVTEKPPSARPRKLASRQARSGDDCETTTSARWRVVEVTPRAAAMSRMDLPWERRSRARPRSKVILGLASFSPRQRAAARPARV